MKRVRADLRMKFEKLFNDDRILEYLYHCNAQTPTGEEAFRTISDFLAWAKGNCLTSDLIGVRHFYFSRTNDQKNR